MPPEYSIGRLTCRYWQLCLALCWLAGRVLLKIVYLLMRWLLGLVVLLSHDRAKDAEPLWGYRRFHGELTKLGVTVAPSTIFLA